MILPRFSFCYNGIPFDKIDKKIENTTAGVLYTLPDGLQIECKIERYPKYNVTKWTNYWHNPTDHNSGTVSKLMDCDIEADGNTIRCTMSFGCKFFDPSKLSKKM